MIQNQNCRLMSLLVFHVWVQESIGKVSWRPGLNWGTHTPSTVQSMQVNHGIFQYFKRD